MDIPITVRPIEAWPRELTRSRQRSNFSATYSQTLALLERELAAIQARNVALQMALTAADIRLDGKPRANSRPSHPGVILSFEIHPYNKPVESYSMPCDTFVGWEDNLRAIALSLESLRKINRYGVTKSNEQYRGWAALPPAPKDDEGFATNHHAALFVAGLSGEKALSIMVDPAVRRMAYQTAVKKVHPDVGGDPADFRRLQNAFKLLEK